MRRHERRRLRLRNQLCQLNEEQSALYLTCTMVAQGAQIPSSLTSNLLGTLDLLSMERTAEFQTQCGNITVSKLPALNGLNYVQLGIAQVKALKDFAVEQYTFVTGGKARTQAITSFETMNNGTCATLAQNFTVPKVPRIKLSTSSLNFGKVPVSTLAFLSFNIANVGTPLLTAKVDASGLNAVFSIQFLSNHPFSLKFGQIFQVFVQFLPTSVTSYSGISTITSNDSSHPSLKVAVSGSGV